MIIKKAEQKDLSEILSLQYLAYQSEAKILNNFDIPPLKQTLSDIEKEFERGNVLKAVNENDEIIGSVRAYLENGTVYIGKLMVRPELQRQGIGTKLLAAIESEFPKQRYELFTSDKSINNISLYKKLGYKIYKTEHILKELNFVYLEK